MRSRPHPPHRFVEQECELACLVCHSLSVCWASDAEKVKGNLFAFTCVHVFEWHGEGLAEN